ncbi:D-alanyl-D-alanine carboxypeptidase [Protaetiibacter larvae]|uniref:D-alanyl-D-alanine carboxypeptidase n=1 Tax=Protaetiibacter larvae TaxID=2592654 RepID=A0A5C1YC84_9MICO|nr:D-alanyl-D-alanine carboxypeptidase [Protaetiibacter larvae]
MGALLRKHPTAWIVSAAAAVFVLLGTGSVFAGVAYASRAEAPVETPEPEVSTPPPPRPVSTLPPTVSRLRTCSIAGAAADPRLMGFQGTILRADTGEVLFDRGGATPARTASVLKVFTAAAAVSALGPDFQIRTSVLDGSTPGTIVLVGRGDATLSALPVGQESFYPGAPKLQTLAEQTIAAYQVAHPGVPITQVVLDASYWNAADKWDPSWKRSEQTIGYHSEVTALQVDGDRADPTKSTSPRSTDPIGRAGAAFLAALKAADTSGTVVDPAVGTALGTAVGQTSFGEVASQPLRTLIKQMLLVSDNTLAEMLARIVSRESGMNGSAASLQQAIPGQLSSTWQVPTAGLVIRDGSGLSDLNAVPATVMASFMRQVRDGTAGLDVVRDGLSVSGKSGGLQSRFTGDNAAARGAVFAKTGWIDTAYTLAGYINAADGTPLTFTFYAIGDGIKESARAALDTLATAAFRCGDNLSNN